MKYLWLSALLFSQVVMAWCPDEDQKVVLQGTLIQQTLPGPPNYESIKDGDEAVTYDYLKLDQPFECDITGESESVPLVQLILMGKSKPGYADLAPSLGKDVILTGKTMYAQTGLHFTSVLLILDDVKDVTPLNTPEQKKSALIQFQQFQQALSEKNVAALKSYFVFPLPGSLDDFIPYDESQSSQSDQLTEAVFDKNASQIIKGLHILSSLDVNPDTLEIKEHRINALSAQEQKRKYFPGDEDGTFYYEENGQRHVVDGTCDTAAMGEFDEGVLRLSQGTDANKQRPGLSESCDGASSYLFKLIDGKLRLVASFTAG
ncbi:DUF4431 domain-containing protein [Citrobacter freundii]|uniref:DUF4431 domain-containing protein n=1 Tax=Citrobacter freundii TaxID=546 RepID=A0AAE7L0K3_CITFR|nr:MULTISPECIES: DUF4431 domain-containing protein [Citrobacter]MCS3465792.1 hypothetical protein [Citrobacter sp. JUb117]QLO15953.1 DUF4431 domain-containing protein [Citrobacter freundii]QLX27244.1 DUF4431 domain-containing protein [Citrobacter freundii]QLY38833.1 DUF4431 domain-containing protein [Citrobacter freundii]QLZ61785.1 DUF4431 domain-containing protein [Citrobacter freundii]